MIALLLVPVPAAAQRTDRPTLRDRAALQQEEKEATGDAADSGLDYQVSYEGDLPGELETLLESVAQLEQQRDRLPATPAALRRRIEDERDRLEAALRSAGYYAFELEIDVDTGTSPAQVEVRIEAGPQFTLSDYRIVYRPVRPEAPPGDGVIPGAAPDVDLRLGMPAQAAPLRAAEQRILVLLARAGYPYAQIARTGYVADHAASTLAAEVTVETGARAVFGPLSVSGLEEVEETYVRRLAQWPEGEVWDQRKLNEVRRRVAETDLFETVVLDYPETMPGPDALVPVELLLGERPHRSVSLGGAITSSDEILRGTASWRHRNLFGSGETLELQALGSFVRQEVRASFTRPHFLRLDQDLIVRTSLRQEDSDAFQETTAAASVGVVRKLNENWTVELNTAFELSEQEDIFGLDRFELVGLPGSIAYDTRDDILNPTKGVLIDTTIAPWVSIGERSSQFVISDTRASTYWAPFATDRLVLAGRARVGTLFFADSRDVPASKRFYAGGGGSVRGYNFRALGPQDDDEDPIGGRSVVEVGLETRLRLTETIGVVPFVDGGQVFNDSVPNRDFDWQWAAGLGFRYFLSGIGPVRLDVAFPLNSREQDDVFEFYISIGQAF